MPNEDRGFIFQPPVDDEDSPVAEVIELTSRKWTRAIVEQLLAHGSLRYNELSNEINGISDKVLSETLESMEEHQLVNRTVVDDRPVKVEYSLTEAGAALEEVMRAVAAWTDIYLAQIDK